MSSRFFKLLAGHLDGLEARLGPQPEIDAIRAAVPKLGRPKGAVGKRMKDVEEIVRQWSENGSRVRHGTFLWDENKHELAERCGASLRTINGIIKRLGLDWRSFQGIDRNAKKKIIAPASSQGGCGGSAQISDEQ